jgi:hypothetical protein
MGHLKITINSDQISMYGKGYVTRIGLKPALWGKAVPAHAMKASSGCRDTGPLILNLTARWS